MTEIEQLLARQTRWQKSRKALSWPEKIRMAEQIRPSVAQWRSLAGYNAAAAHRSKSVRA